MDLKKRTLESLVKGLIPVLTVTLLYANSVHSSHLTSSTISNSAKSNNALSKNSKIVKSRFKKALRIIESSDGKNTNHKLLTTGIHAGTRAVGEYGMMPLTAVTHIKRLKIRRTLVPRYIKYLCLDKFQMQKILEQDKGFYAYVVDSFVDEVISRSLTAQEADFRWNQGENIKRENIDFTHPRIKKFTIVRNDLINSELINNY